MSSFYIPVSTQYLNLFVIINVNVKWFLLFNCMTLKHHPLNLLSTDFMTGLLVVGPRYWLSGLNMEMVKLF